MSQKLSDDRLTRAERLQSRFLRWSPPLVFLLLALPPPAYFLFRYFNAAENPGEYMVFALTSLAVFSLVGLLAAFAIVIYRKFWERRLRDRLAADGVTTSELPWFMSEVPAAQRRALKQMEAQSPLLADAYRETLAANVTASRVLARARRESAEVEARLSRAADLSAAGRAELEEGLLKDRARLERVEREAADTRREIEARLQLIEAMAGRDASLDETELALQRLGSVRENVPLGLSSVRSEQEARDEVERELREPGVHSDPTESIAPDPTKSTGQGS